MGRLYEYVQMEADKKGICKEEYLLKLAGCAKRCEWATHIGRFTHPSANVTVQVDAATQKNEGYVTTRSSKCAVDMSVGAADSPAAKFLDFPLEDGRNVYSHLLSDSNCLEKEMPNLSLDYAALQNLFLQAKTKGKPSRSDERLRQVYFPVDGNDNYHVLTILPPSSLMLELRSRIQALEQTAREAKVAKNPLCGTKHQEIWNLTEIAFGGTKPQNISYLNNKFHGRTDALPSLPPQLEEREVIRPTKDFFKSNLSWNAFYSLFVCLNGCYHLDRSNYQIRQQVRGVERQIIEQVIFEVYRLRETEAGWSKGEQNHLSQAQKIWLDNAFWKERLTEDFWQDEIVRSFTKWMGKRYERVAGQEKILLGEAERAVWRETIREAVVNSL